MSDPVLERIWNDVRTVGWSVMSVFSPADDPSPGPGFMYTVGLTYSYQAPEIIVFALPTKIGHRLLNKLGRRVKEGERLVMGRRYEDVANMPVQFLAVDPAHHHYFGTASYWYRDSLSDPSAYSALQLVWPDKDSRFPWEPEADPALAPMQPLLGG